ncbi:MAG: hypothetical protein ABJB85_10730 [Nitrososphaerota archaeon]
MNSLGIVIIFMTLVVISMDKNYTAFGDKTLDVTVKLSNTEDSIGTYKVHVTIYGKETLEQSKVIDTSTQTCPDDIGSLCYVSAGTFSFASQSVPVDSKIQVCVNETSSETQNCVYGKNTKENTPEIITVGVPHLN